MRELDWWNCYSDSFKGKIVDAAYSHPAKMAWGLTVRIFQHLFEMGWLKEGDLIADPFGGIGTTGLIAASFGCPCVLIELEPKFVDLAKQSFELHRVEWKKMNKPYPICIQGDSRQFSSVIRAAVQAIVCSPPYAEGGGHGGQADRDILRSKNIYMPCDEYGATDGQIGAMAEGNLDGVVAGILTSPPFLDSLATKVKDDSPTAHGLLEDGTRRGGSLVTGDYGQSEGQLGSMPEGDHTEIMEAIITSPPYANSMSSEKSGIDFTKAKKDYPGRQWHEQRVEQHKTRMDAQSYSTDPANMGNLPEGSHEEVVLGIVTSPPWEKTSHERTFDSDEELEAFAKQQWVYYEGGRSLGATKAFLQKGWQGYGETAGQIGQEESETYWSSVAQVYQECFKVLKPQGCLVVVVKSFVRQGAIVDLPSQTLELLEAIGFEPLERIRAWMIESEYETTLFDEKTEWCFYEEAESKRRVKWEERTVRMRAEGKKPSTYRPYDFEGWLTAWRQKKRASFFRRDHEKKGSPAIDFEVVLVVRKPFC